MQQQCLCHPLIHHQTNKIKIKKNQLLSRKKKIQQRPENPEAAALCRCYNCAGMSELFLGAIS
jgi:hypothetical protein